ncbi:MAG: hypothetical protein ISQ08_11160 [Planctomycetes bacterium]|nr:hypothetical protein [Planctomycetota bacterium]
MLRSLLLLLTCALGAVAPSAAQLPEDPGPHAVGFRSVTFSHPLAGNSTVTADIHYPALSAGTNAAADPASGPYPLVLFSHGFFAPPSFYSGLTSHLASHGFVVLSVSTETGFVQDLQDQAQDGQALLHWADERSADPSHFLFGMAAPGAWGAMGHSNGCAAIGYSMPWEPRIEVAVLMEGNWFNDLPIASFEGALISVGATEDGVTPMNANARNYFEQADGARRALFPRVVGGGHNGSLNFPVGANSLSHAEQNRLHRRLAVVLFQAELRGDEDQHLFVLGSGAAGEPLEADARCKQPLLWTSASPSGELTLGLAGLPADEALLAWTLAPAAQATSLSGFGLSGTAQFQGPLPASGLIEVTTAGPIGAAGTRVTARGLRTQGGDRAPTRVARLRLP